MKSQNHIHYTQNHCNQSQPSTQIYCLQLCNPTLSLDTLSSSPSLAAAGADPKLLDGPRFSAAVTNLLIGAGARNLKTILQLQKHCIHVLVGYIRPVNINVHLLKHVKVATVVDAVMQDIICKSLIALAYTIPLHATIAQVNKKKWGGGGLWIEARATRSALSITSPKTFWCFNLAKPRQILSFARFAHLRG